MRFQSLDACRGLSALGVVLFHMRLLTHFHEIPFVKHGFLGVEFFFVLSGFVLASAYGGRITNARAALAFALRRLGRLYPLHGAVLLVMAAAACLAWLGSDPRAFAHPHSVPELAANLALIQGFGAWSETWNAPAWSISIELWGNLLLGMVLWALSLTPDRIRSAVGVVTAIVVLGLSAGVARSLHALEKPLGDPTLWAQGKVALAVFAFTLGMTTFAIFDRLRTAGWRPWGAWEGLAVVLLVCAYQFAFVMPIPAVFAVPLAFAAAVFILAFEAGPMSRVLRRPMFQELGAISYSIYLTHTLYLRGLGQVIKRLGGMLGRPVTEQVHGVAYLSLGGPWAMDAAAALCLLTIVLGSRLTYRLIEAPARRTFNALSARLAGPLQSRHIS